MAYHLNVKKLIQDLRGPKGVAALTEELVKVSNEVNRLKSKVQPTAEKGLHQAKANLDQVQKKLKKAQIELDHELKKTVTVLKKYSSVAENRIVALGREFKKAVTKKKAARPRKAKTARRSTKKQA